VLNHHLLRIDGRKSWDVAYFADLLDRSTDRTAGVADVGSVGSELPWILHLAGFQRIIGCDLDSCVTRMPFGRFIDYRHGDFAEVVTEVDLGAVTAVSTIEHGINPAAFFDAVAKRLRTGGFLCMSTDYWPVKLNTSDMRPFGLPWTIFSEEEIRFAIDQAADAGLILDGWDGRIPLPTSAPVSWNGFAYTFILLVFIKQ